LLKVFEDIRHTDLVAGIILPGSQNRPVLHSGFPEEPLSRLQAA